MLKPPIIPVTFHYWQRLYRRYHIHCTDDFTFTDSRIEKSGSTGVHTVVTTLCLVFKHHGKKT